MFSTTIFARYAGAIVTAMLAGGAMIGCQCPCGPGGTAPARPARSGWRLVWQDEFDGQKLDDSAWGRETGFLRNEELQYYTDRPANAYVADGQLVLVARQERFANAHYDPQAPPKDWKRARSHATYTSASLTTAWRKSWTHARVEVRAKLPTGRGVWPAIWMLGHPRPRLPWPERGEIDIVEHVGHQPGVVHGSVHTGAFNHSKGTHKTGKVGVDDLASAFHVYWVQWDEKVLTIGVDEKTVLTVENDGQGLAHWPFDHPYFLILNIAVGGFWGGAEGVDPDVFPVRMAVDWVRVWQRADTQD